MPPARFVTGSVRELEDVFTEALAAARAADRLAPVTVVVGHTLLKSYLPRMLALRGHAHINVRFHSPGELAQSLAPDLAAKTRLTRAAEGLLLRHTAGSAGGYFAGISRGEGFVDALGRLFRDLDLGGFEAASLFAIAADPANAGRLNTAKLDEIARLYDTYGRERGSAGIAGRADAFAHADPARIEGPLLVYGVWDPAELPLRLIESLANAHDVTVFLPASGLDADDAHGVIRTRLGGVPEAHAADPGNAIEHVGARLFRTNTQETLPEIDAGDAVALVSAPDTVREVWEAARTCLRWAEEGIDFHEMAVVYRNRDPYRALVDEIFGVAGIPTYLHDGRPLASHPLGRRLLALLDLAADTTFLRRDVMEFLTETRIPTETDTRYGRVTPSVWESYTREAGVVAGIDQWRERLARLAREKREHAATADGYEWMAKQSDRIDTLIEFAADFHTALTSRAGEATWSEHLAFLRDLASRYAADVDPIVDALGALVELEAIAPRVSFDAFCRAVRDDLESRDTSAVLGEPLRSFGRQGVAVVDATSLRHLRFRAVYMLGAGERAWPPPLRPDPLLLEHERAAINEASSAAKLPLRTAPDAEPLQFWTGIQSARDHLVVSYARADASSVGKHLPSYFFRAVAEALLGRALTLDDLETTGIVRRIEAGRLATDDVAASVTLPEYDRGLIRAHLAGEQPGAVAALTGVTPLFERAIRARLRRWSATLSPYDGVFEDDAAVALAAGKRFGRERPVSPSRLEMYATCPYRYFMRYGLRVEPVEEPEDIERLDHLERGSLIHAILEAFLTRVGRDDPPRADARVRHIILLLGIAHEEFSKREERGVTGRALIWAMDQRVIADDLVRWYDEEVTEAAETGLLPGAFEVGFGGVGYSYGVESHLTSDEPLVLQAGGYEIRLQGRIDRVDWNDARSRFRVIDYKTGKAHPDRGVDKGTALQLPIYVRAAAQLLGLDHRLGEAQYFYASSRGGFKRVTMTGAGLVERAADFERILATIAEGADNGYFAPNPGSKRENCTFCDYKHVCDARIDTLMQRKGPDPRAAAFVAMQDIT